MKKIVAFAGSNSNQSINHKLILLIAKYLDVEFEILDLKEYPAPVFDPDEEAEKGAPETMKLLKKKMDSANGYIIASPEYNGSMPAVLKNTFDWLSTMGQKILQDKPTVFLSATPGPRGGTAVLNHLVDIMPYRGAIVVGSHGVGEFAKKNDGSVLTSDEDIKIIESLIRKLETAL
ncbi:MAG: NAD(P)H-dependent oxidoreductase [Flavobacteriales bacterium]|nr:NAD(P)H-dependent oxidoreductase [Flavobacteriales bacterium]